MFAYIYCRALQFAAVLTVSMTSSIQKYGGVSQLESWHGISTITRWKIELSISCLAAPTRCHERTMTTTATTTAIAMAMATAAMNPTMLVRHAMPVV